MVTGRVQGVGYRAGAARVAEAAGVSGFARNAVDGSVVIELEGPAVAVDAVISWCRSGPRWAEVVDVTVEDVAVVGSTRFDVG